MHVKFLTAAESDLLEAVSYYNEQKEDLGFEFSKEIQRAVFSMVDFPDAWPALNKNYRRCRLQKFPYGIFYRVQDKSVIIVAILHLHRNPESWRSRLQ
jgi:toxin ParE2